MTARKLMSKILDPYKLLSLKASANKALRLSMSNEVIKRVVLENSLFRFYKKHAPFSFQLQLIQRALLSDQQEFITRGF